jgi:hypothetical protein
VRANIAVFGAALIVVGLVFWYFPLTTGSTTTPVPQGDGYDYGLPGALIIGPVPYTASWTSSTPANVTIFSCGTDSGCPNGPDSSVVAQANSTSDSGSISWTSSGGHYFLLVPSVTANVTVSYMEPVGGGLVGIGVLGLGAIVGVAGLAARRPPPAGASAVPAPPSSP